MLKIVTSQTNITHISFICSSLLIGNLRVIIATIIDEGETVIGRVVVLCINVEISCK